MKLSCSLLIVSAQVLSVLALPAPSGAGQVAVISTTADAATTTTGEAAATTSAGAGAGDGAGAGEGAGDDIEQQAQFGEVVQLGGGNIKTDVLFPPGVSLSAHTSYSIPPADTLYKTNGVFEIEFQNLENRQLRVTENPNPAPPPNGFVALEPVSYIVELGGGAAAAAGLTLQKIDYILNAGSESLPSLLPRLDSSFPCCSYHLPFPSFSPLFPTPFYFHFCQP